MKGSRIAVVGMGRSGLGIASAGIDREAQVTVYDEKSPDTPERIAAVEHLEALGVEVVTGWHGRLTDEPYDLLVTSPGFRRDHPAILDALASGKEVVSEVEFAYRIAAAPIIAITGTNGKSTTTVMTYLMLEAAGARPVLCGNISGSGYPEQTLTEAAASADADQVLVAEVSSYQLEWVSRFRPRVATVTNVTPDHMDRHPDFHDYFATKMRIFAGQGSGCTAVWNALEPSVSREAVVLAGGPGTNLMSFGATADQIRNASGKLNWGAAAIAHADLPVLGDHNYTNAAQSAALCSAYLGPDAPAQACLDALRDFRALGHRMENLGSKNGVMIVNNSMCTNPGAVIASSRALRAPQWLLMGGVMKGLDFAPVGEYLRESAHRPVLFSEFRQQLATQLQVDAPGFDRMEDAFDFACGQANPGDVVMLAPGCASAYPFENFRERGEAFRAMAARWLSE